MVFHSEITDTSIQKVGSKPTIAPTSFESKIRFQVATNGLFVWVWNPGTSQWEGCTVRASTSIQLPSDITFPVVPLHFGQKHFSTTSSRLYYAAGTTENDWIDYGYPTGGGGSGGS